MWAAAWLATLAAAFAGGWFTDEADEGNGSQRSKHGARQTQQDSADGEVAPTDPALPIVQYEKVKVGMTMAQVKQITNGPQISGPTSIDGRELTCWAWEQAPGSRRALAVCYDALTKRVALLDPDFEIPEAALDAPRPA